MSSSLWCKILIFYYRKNDFTMKKFLIHKLNSRCNSDVLFGKSLLLFFSWAIRAFHYCSRRNCNPTLYLPSIRSYVNVGGYITASNTYRFLEIKGRPTSTVSGKENEWGLLAGGNCSSWRAKSGVLAPESPSTRRGSLTSGAEVDD